jgi:hypothetical protein
MVTIGYRSGGAEGQGVGPIIQPLFGGNSGISFGPVEADPATSANSTIDANNLDEVFRKGLHLLLSRLFNLARRRAALPCSTKNPLLATKMRPVEETMEKEARNLFGMGQTTLGNPNRPTVNRRSSMVVLFVLGKVPFDG